MKRTIVAAVLAAGAAGFLPAQNPTPDVQRLADQLRDRVAQVQLGNVQFVAGQLVSGATVKGAPYSAEAVTETTQSLADGNRIVKRSSSQQYRDSEGRERKEETSAMGAIFITDPVAQVSYTLHPETQTAEKTAAGKRAVFYYNQALNLPAAPGGGANPGPGRGLYALRLPESQAPPTILLNGQQLVIGNPGADPNAKVEQLAAMQIEGVQAQGTRTTTTIPAGQIGNERPINVVDERWYSPDLQMTVMTKHSDPREGETVFKLTNIRRIEQVRSLFEIPSNYTVNESSGLVPVLRVAGAGGGRGRGAPVLTPPPHK